MAVERFFLELNPPDEELRSRPHVVVVGGGFAGLKAVQALAGQPMAAQGTAGPAGTTTVNALPWPV